MPIYEYRCSSCGFEEEYLQKVGAALLTTCPECGKATFEKKVTAAGFQLKGSGWYATDFKNSGGKAKETKSESKSVSTAPSKTETNSETKSTDTPAATTSSSSDSSSTKT